MPSLNAITRIAAGLIILGLLIALQIRTGERNDARRHLRDCIEQKAALQAHVNQWEAEAARRSEAAARALEEARRINAQQAGTITALRRSAQRPRGPSEPCTISPELRNAQGAL